MKNLIRTTIGLPIICCVLLFGIDASAVTPEVNEVAKLLANDANHLDRFGISAAVDGDTAIIGAHVGQLNTIEPGAAYVFIHSAGGWTQQQKLTGNDPAHATRFGISVDVDGDTAVVGRWHLGNAYVFTRSGGVWTQQQKLAASDAPISDSFGYSVSVDGDTALVGAYLDDENGTDAGAAYVFTRTSGVWSQQQKITASDGAGGDQFGSSVSLYGDTVVIGALRDDEDGTDAGAAYVFTRTSGVWSQQQKITASDGVGGDWFGYSVGVDGDTVVIGAENDDDNGNDAGSAYVFTRTSGVWTQQQKLTASDGANGDGFGNSVDVEMNTAVISAPWGGSGAAYPFGNAGAAYVFTRTAGVWTERLKLLASDGRASDLLGFLRTSVGVSGSTVIAGASGHDTAFGANVGAAYVFSANFDDEGPITSNVLANPNPVAVNTGLTITAIVDDSTTGGSNIASAAYTLDGGTGIAMEATDGDFDEVIEYVTATLADGLPVGVYDVCVFGTDAVDNTGAEECTFLAVYDPSAGFVTGGGWIDSPIDAYVADPTLTGKANFGFVAKYKKGASTPTGQTQFHFSAGNMNFHSNSYQWLVVNQHGTNAQYKGAGTVNGSLAPTGEEYKFMIWASDGGNADPVDADTFRIKIWYEVGGEIVVYDNGFDQAIGGGSIVIHTAKDKK